MSQNFKKKYDSATFLKIIKEYCIHEKKTEYIFSPISYKKMQFNKILPEFINSLTPYYHKSKQYYVERKMNYNRFMTIIRQICKINGVSFVSNLKYDKSNYDIYYFIYFKK